MNRKVVTFGEIMLRLSPPDRKRINQADTFDVVYGGGEANVAVSLANYGIEVHFVTKVPKNPLGQSAINHLRRYGVKTDYIIRGGNRLGIYFLEMGVSQRPSKVVYDRAYSAIAEADKNDFNWEEIFKDARWFHFTGITPAISDKAAAATLEACKTAKKLDITISADLNYRKNLWSTEKACRVMSELMQYVDIVIGNEEDTEKVFGIKAVNSDVSKGKLDLNGYKKVSKELVNRFGFKYVTTTLRESFSASDNAWSGLLYDGAEFYLSKNYKIHIVDRVGGGDSFAAGIIYGLLLNESPKDTIEFAVAASCLKHTIPGDMNMVNVQEVEDLIKGGGSGRVKR
ncbi:2-dehydro-3-deoxygluconokinase [Candidatus Atribacteria bacterium HGW-Atribacteria-1]|nr:MAG: 2-dehydro-3-deoxygluconokinase [Candidatus Atribacteria bacterium HGW-Atribacteria-1]